MVGNPEPDVVDSGGGLLAQRPYQPARRPHAGQLARRTLISATATDPAARPPPQAGTTTSRLTAQPGRHPPLGPATSTVGGTTVRSVRVIALVGAAGQAQSDGRSGSRVESGRGASLSTGPASPGPSSAAVAAVVAEGPAAARRMTRHAGPWPLLEVIACLDRHVGLIWFAA